MRLRKFDLPPEVSDNTFRAFLRLYQLETWTREMVYLELKAYYGLDWWNEAESALRRARIPVHLTERYLARDKRHPHISTPENDPLWFISFDSLLKVIFDPKHWKLFKSYFTTKGLLRMRLEEILPIRNRVAHCRSLHTYDVDRLNQFMRDFDQGFWRFCTSYGDQYQFTNTLAKNDVYSYFMTAKKENINLFYSMRPYVRGRKPKVQLGPDFIYDFTVYTRYPSRYFDYERILKYTRSVHRFVLHIMLDGSQHSLRVTFPSTLSSKTIIEAAERFADVAHNTYSLYPLVRQSGEVEKDKADETDYSREAEERNRPFQEIASNWPHYVVPSSHPYTFLDRECPCSFFG
jgi:hypothetical protein